MTKILILFLAFWLVFQPTFTFAQAVDFSKVLEQLQVAFESGDQNLILMSILQLLVLVLFQQQKVSTISTPEEKIVPKAVPEKKVSSPQSYRPKILILEPEGGEVFYAGEYMAIRWFDDIPDFKETKIFLEIYPEHGSGILVKKLKPIKRYLIHHIPRVYGGGTRTFYYRIPKDLGEIMGPSILYKIAIEIKTETGETFVRRLARFFTITYP